MTFTLQDAQRRDRKLARKQDELRGRMASGSSRRDRRRLARLNNLREENQRDLDFLTGQKDEVSYELVRNKDGDFFGVNVTITDSIFDETFTGGKRAKLYLSGSGEGSKPFSTLSFGTTSSLVPATFENATDTFFVASSTWVDKLDGSFDVTASLKQDGLILFTETLI